MATEREIEKKIIENAGQMARILVKGKDNVFRVTSSDTFTVSVDDEDVITFKFNQANFNEE